MFLPGLLAGELRPGWSTTPFASGIRSKPAICRTRSRDSAVRLRQGIAALVASPSASVFLYSPVALAGVAGLALLFRTRARGVAVFCSAMILCFLCFYATLGNWLGGRSYGSRYLLVVLPFFGVGWAAALAALAPRRRLLVLALVGGLGFVIQLPGVLIDYAKVSQAVGSMQRPFTTEERQWRWEASPLVLNARALERAWPDNVDYLFGRRPPPAVVVSAGEADRSFSQQFSFSLDVWWLYLYYLHVLSRPAVAMVIAGFAAAIGLVATRVWRNLGDTLQGEPGGHPPGILGSAAPGPGHL